MGQSGQQFTDFTGMTRKEIKTPCHDFHNVTLNKQIISFGEAGMEVK